MEHQITVLPIFCPRIFNIACALDVKLQELTYDDVHEQLIVIDHETNTYRIMTQEEFDVEYYPTPGLMIPTYMATRR